MPLYAAIGALRGISSRSYGYVRWESPHAPGIAEPAGWNPWPDFIRQDSVACRVSRLGGYFLPLVRAEWQPSPRRLTGSGRRPRRMSIALPPVSRAGRNGLPI